MSYITLGIIHLDTVGTRRGDKELKKNIRESVLQLNHAEIIPGGPLNLSRV
jgi:hypothetical protein